MKILSIVCGILVVGCIILGLMVIDQNNQYATGYYQGWEDASRHSTELATDAYNEGWDDGYFVGEANTSTIRGFELLPRTIK